MALPRERPTIKIESAVTEAKFAQPGVAVPQNPNQPTCGGHCASNGNNTAARAIGCFLCAAFRDTLFHWGGMRVFWLLNFSRGSSVSAAHFGPDRPLKRLFAMRLDAPQRRAR